MGALYEKGTAVAHHIWPGPVNISHVKNQFRELLSSPVQALLLWFGADDPALILPNRLCTTVCLYDGKKVLKQMKRSITNAAPLQKYENEKKPAKKSIEILSEILET